MTIGQALTIAASNFTLSYNPSLPVTQTIVANLSATLTSQGFTGSNKVSASVNNLNIQQDGFTLGSLDIPGSGTIGPETLAGGSISIGGVNVELSDFNLQYNANSNVQSFTPTFSPSTTPSVTLQTAAIPGSVVVAESNSDGSHTNVLSAGAGAAYTLVPASGNVTGVKFSIDSSGNFTGTSIHAAGTTITITYTTSGTNSTVSGAITFTANNVVLFPNVPSLNVSVGTLSGSYDFSNSTNPGQMELAVGNLNIPIGDLATIQSGQRHSDPWSNAVAQCLQRERQFGPDFRVGADHADGHLEHQQPDHYPAAHSHHRSGELHANWRRHDNAQTRN